MMEPPKPEPLRPKDIVCLGHLKRVFQLLDALPKQNSRRDRAGNRALFLNDYLQADFCCHVWNPLIDSLRVLQQSGPVGECPPRPLHVKRISLGSFSEAPAAFNPEQLKGVMNELAGELGPLAGDPRLAQVSHAITLVWIRRVLTALSRLARSAVGLDARYTTCRDGRAVYGWRLHTQLDLKTFAPHHIDRTGARNAADQRENNVLRDHLEAGRCYVGDGGYADQSLFNAIVDADSSYVMRMRQDSVLEVVQERLLSDEALAANIVRDALVRMGAGHHPIRMVAVQVQPHPRRTRKDPAKQSDLILLATSLLDLPAELIALIYLYRYTIELFFRVFKQLLGLRHLISQRPNGIDIQVYCTVIVCLLICLITGKQPNKYNRNIIGWYLMGLASQQELLNHLDRPDNTGIKKKAKEELWKKLGF